MDVIILAIVYHLEVIKNINAMDIIQSSHLLCDDPDLLHESHPFAFDTPELRRYLQNNEIAWTETFVRACQYFMIHPPIERQVLQYLKLHQDQPKRDLAIRLHLVPPSIVDWDTYTDDERYKHGVLWGLDQPNLSRFARAGHLPVVQYLIEHGVNVHAEDDAALRLASMNGRLAVVQCLIEHGANVHAKNDWALYTASSGGHSAVVQCLVKCGANVHAKNGEALRAASLHGHLPVVKCLIEYGANVHALSDWSIVLASEHGHLPVVQYLLDHGANAHRWGAWLLQVVHTKGYVDVGRLLTRHLSTSIP